MYVWLFCVCEVCIDNVFDCEFIVWVGLHLFVARVYYAFYVSRLCFVLVCCVFVLFYAHRCCILLCVSCVCVFVCLRLFFVVMFVFRFSRFLLFCVFFWCVYICVAFDCDFVCVGLFLFAISFVCVFVVCELCFGGCFVIFSVVYIYMMYLISCFLCLLVVVACCVVTCVCCCFVQCCVLFFFVVGLCFFSSCVYIYCVFDRASLRCVFGWFACF